MLIENKTVLDEKTITVLSRNSLKAMLKVLIALSVLIIGLGLIVVLSKLDKTIGYTLIIAGAVVPAAMYLLMYFLVPKKVKKTAEKMIGTVQIYKFGDKISIDETSAYTSAKNVEYEWSFFCKASENENYFFIYNTKYSSVIIDKSGFIQGDAKELRELLASKFGKNFTGRKSSVN